MVTYGSVHTVELPVQVAEFWETRNPSSRKAWSLTKPRSTVPKSESPEAEVVGNPEDAGGG